MFIWPRFSVTGAGESGQLLMGDYTDDATFMERTIANKRMSIEPFRERVAQLLTSEMSKWEQDLAPTLSSPCDGGSTACAI